MALTATMHQVRLVVSDVDRGVYETIELRVARHPSETLRFMLTRILAYGLSYCEGITFSKAGLSDVDEPALSVFDLTGRRLVWVEIGSPAADRLHKASKATPKVVIYTSADLGQLRREATSRPVHKLEDIDVWHIEPALLAALEADVDRKTDLEVLRTGDRLYVTTRSGTHEGALVKVQLAE